MSSHLTHSLLFQSQVWQTYGQNKKKRLVNFIKKKVHGIRADKRSLYKSLCINTWVLNVYWYKHA